MPKSLTATATETIAATPAQVWEALTSPAQIKQYYFGSDVITSWEEGSPIVYRGEWQGKQFEDKGTVVKVSPPETLICTHWSPLSGTPDSPENYHQVTYSLRPEGRSTVVSVSQDNNADEDEKQHSEQMWKMMLENMKRVLEK